MMDLPPTESARSLLTRLQPSSSSSSTHPPPSFSPPQAQTIIDNNIAQHVKECSRLLKQVAVAKARSDVKHGARVMELGKHAANIRHAIRLLEAWRAFEEGNDAKNAVIVDHDLWSLADSLTCEPGTPLHVTKMRLLDSRRKAVEDLMTSFDNARRTSDFATMKRDVEILNSTPEGSSALGQFLVRLAIRPITLAMRNPPVTISQVRLLFSQLSASVNECMATLHGLPPMQSSTAEFVQSALVESLPGLFTLMFPRMISPPPTLAKERVQLLVATRRYTEELFTGLNSDASVFSFFALEFPKLELSMFEALFASDFPTGILDKDDTTRVLVRNVPSFVEEKLLARSTEAHARRVLFFSGKSAGHVQNSAFAETLFATTCARFRDVVQLIIRDARQNLLVDEQETNMFLETSSKTSMSLLQKSSSSFPHHTMMDDISLTHLAPMLRDTFDTIETCCEALTRHALQVGGDEMIPILETTLSWVEAELSGIFVGFCALCFRMITSGGSHALDDDNDQRYNVVQGDIASDEFFTRIDLVLKDAIDTLQQANMYTTKFGDGLAAIVRDSACLRLSRVRQVTRSCGAFAISRELTRLASMMDDVFAFDGNVNPVFAQECKQMGMVFVVGEDASDMASVLSEGVVTLLLSKLV